MKQKLFYVFSSCLLLFSASLFCECSFEPTHVYFNETIYNSWVIYPRGTCIITNLDKDKEEKACTFIYPYTDYTGSPDYLPNDIDFINISYPAPPEIKGVAEEGTTGDYKYRLNTKVGSGGIHDNCIKVGVLTVTVLPATTPLPPMSVSGTQVEKLPVPLSFAKAKKIFPINNYENIIRWKKAKTGPTIVAFRIYRDKELTKLVQQVPAHKRSSYKYSISHRNPNKNYTYYLLSVSDQGEVSPAIPLKIKGLDKHKKIKKHRHCNCG